MENSKSQRFFAFKSRIISTVAITSLLFSMLILTAGSATKLGDVDGDNTVTVSDARLVLRAAINLEKYTKSSVLYLAGNVDGDSTLSVNDARAVLRVAIGLDSFGATGTENCSYKLGFIGPLTGGAGIYGMAAMQGAELAVAEINAKDGIKFELNAYDDVHDAKTSVNAYNALLDWGMQALVGTVTTYPCIAVSAKAAEDRLFMLTPSASSTDVIADKDNMFQVCFTDPNQGIASADYIAENFDGAKVAVIYKNDDAYSQGIRDTFVKEAVKKNLELVYEGTFTEDTQTYFWVQVASAQAAAADVVFLPLYYTPASIIIKQAAYIGYTPTFFGVDGLDGILELEDFDTSLAEGVMLLTPFSADAEDAADFVAAYQYAYGEIPNQFAADAYDAVYIIYEALQKAECTPDMDHAEICEKLIAAITAEDFVVDGLTGKSMRWNASGEVSKTPNAVVIENGVYVTPRF